ncbi:LptA/OstA family protein [Pseudooceanicola spongiae]|nr:LptA/OstA family protein [Pseudooceanicola spongiae]
MPAVDMAVSRPFRAIAMASLAALSLALPAALLIAPPALAQETSVSFGTGSGDTKAPINVDSDTLSVSQTDGTAVFEGNVKVAQNDMKLSAPRVLVVYNQAGDEIDRLEATGGVTLVSGEDAAEGDRADYDVVNGNIVMRGNVLLLQGNSTIASEVMHVDLDSGSARMEGRVRTILQSGKE